MYIVKRELKIGTAYFTGYVTLHSGAVTPNFSFNSDEALHFENYGDAFEAREKWGKGAYVDNIGVKEEGNEILLVCKKDVIGLIEQILFVYAKRQYNRHLDEMTVENVFMEKGILRFQASGVVSSYSGMIELKISGCVADGEVLCEKWEEV